MLAALRLAGYGLTVLGLAGMLVAGGLYVHQQSAQERALETMARLHEVRVGAAVVTGPRAPELALDHLRQPGADVAQAAPAVEQRAGGAATPREAAVTASAPISRVRLGRIGLDAEVVKANLVQVAGGITWEVPAFRVGHGEQSAGAGEEGNAVLLGHVTSLNAGNVFRDLNRAKPGDDVWLTAGERQLRYVVTEVRSVDRTDVSVLGPRPGRWVSLITCTGAWLPALSDYAERLVVWAELDELAGT